MAIVEQPSTSVEARELEAGPRHASPDEALGVFKRPQGDTGWRSWLFTVDHKKIGIMYGAAALFFFLIARALHIGSMVGNRFYSLIAIGLASMLTFHVFINIGMTIGVMPVTGLPLPFLSSGGSSLLSNLIAVGLLLHIYTYRHEY